MNRDVSHGIFRFDFYESLVRASSRYLPKCLLGIISIDTFMEHPISRRFPVNPSVERGLLWHTVPEKYKQFLKEDGGELVDTAYTEPEKTASDCEIPRLVVSMNVNDICAGTADRYRAVYYDREYDEDGYPMESYGEAQTGLDQYCLFFREGKPLYVFDNHSHALFAWIEAKEAGVLGEENVLIRFDAHSDLEPNAGPRELTRDIVKKAIVQEEIDIKNFTEPALYQNLIREVYLSIGSRSDLISLADRAAGGMTLHGELATIKRYAASGRFHDFSTASLEDPESVLELVQNLHEKGKKIILDIDFDVFEREEAQMLKYLLPQIAKIADVVTCATSPGYIRQGTSISLVRNFVRAFLD